MSHHHWHRLFLATILLLSTTGVLFAGDDNSVDTRRWSIHYWQSLARQGLVPVTPEAPVPPAIITESSVPDGPDIAVINAGNTTQSETSIFVSPLNNNILLNSNNSTNWTGSTVTTLYGTSHFHSNDGGLTWPAPSTVNGPAGSNYGDPAAAIGLGGRQYIGYISLSFGMGVAYSSNSGTSWTGVNLPAGGSLDKNHLWIDNSSSSPYEGNLYNSWTNFSSPYGEIEVMRSTNDGVSWTNEVAISTPVPAGSHHQGVNLQTGPNGEVYAAWALYQQWSAGQYAEDGIGFARSTDGGVTWPVAYQIPMPGNGLIKGIRGEGSNLSGSFPVRLASFPVMATDISGGPYDGRTYIVWTNIGVPGTNTGTNWDVYMTYSDDPGNSGSWSTPAVVNQNTNSSRRNYYPWITCDPVTGNISVVYHDNRNDASPGSSHLIEVWVNNSTDGGATWCDEFKVSDVQFTPAPISGLAFGYMGDYIGCAARGGKVYPVWADNRQGNVLTWVSGYTFDCGGGGNLPPVANANGPYAGTEGIPVNFSSAGSNDPDGSIASYFWDFGDGGTSTLANPSHTYVSAGLYNVSLEVTDNEGATDTDNTTADIEGAGGGIPCSDFSQIQARCRNDGSITAKVVMTTTAYSGQTIEVTIDGADVYAATINGRRATISTPSGYAPGPHTLVVTDPNCPGVSYEVSCPGADNLDLAWDEELNWSGEIPSATELIGNYPNPFNPSTTIAYSLVADSYVTLKVYNTLGQEVASLVNEDQTAGFHTALWNGQAHDGAQVASGIYLYRLVAGDVVLTEKMMLMK